MIVQLIAKKMLGPYGLYAGLAILRKVLLKANVVNKQPTLGEQENFRSEQGMCAKTVILVG